MMHVMSRVTLLLLFIFISSWTAHAKPAIAISVEQIQALRDANKQSQKVWDEYLRLQEVAIERLSIENPAVLREAAQLYERFPEIVVHMRNDALATGARGIVVEPEAELEQLDTAVEHWLGEKTASVERELRLAFEELKIAGKAFEPLPGLVSARERKQKVIRDVALIIVEVLKQDSEENGEQEPDQEKGKTDRLTPSARQGTDAVNRFATK
jgi:hypothetical protein